MPLGLLASVGEFTSQLLARGRRRSVTTDRIVGVTLATDLLQKGVGRIGPLMGLTRMLFPSAEPRRECVFINDQAQRRWKAPLGERPQSGDG